MLVLEPSRGEGLDADPNKTNDVPQEDNPLIGSRKNLIVVLEKAIAKH